MLLNLLFVQIIKNFDRLFRLFTKRQTLGFIAIFFIATSINAEETVAISSRRQPELLAASCNESIQNGLLAHLEKSASRRRDPLMLVHENLRTTRSFEVCIGYEQLWNDSTTLPKICGRQDTGCAGLKASFSF